MKQENKKENTNSPDPIRVIISFMSMPFFLINYIVFNKLNNITITYTPQGSIPLPEAIMITSSVIAFMVLCICYHSHTNRGYFKTIIIIYLLHLIINFSYLGINNFYKSQSTYIKECIVYKQVNQAGRFGTIYTILKFSDGKKWKTNDEYIYKKFNIGDRITFKLQDGYYNLPIVVDYEKIKTNRNK